MSNPKLDLVKLTGVNCKNALKFQQANNDIDEKIKTLGDISHLENDTSFVLHLMNLVQNVRLKKKQTGLEKKEFVLNKLKQLFPNLNNDKDIKRLEKLIDWLKENQLVQKITDTAVVSNNLFSYILKKVV